MTRQKPRPSKGTGLPLGRPVVWSSPEHSRTSERVQGRSESGNSVPTSGAHLAIRRRVGDRSLRLILEALSPRDLAILHSVAEHRFLGTRHIEALHFHDHATALSGARSARRVLRRLHGYRLLDHLERRVGGIRAGSAGYIWTLGPVGVRVLAETQAGSARRQAEPSLRLLNHCLAIAEVHVELIEASRDGRFELAAVQLEPHSWRRFLGLGAEIRLVRPDLAVVTAVGEYEDHWFMEVDLGSEHPPMVVRKCRLYLDYQAGGSEQERLGVFPRIVWVVPDQRRLDRLSAALRQADLDPALFRITTTETVTDLIAGGAI